MTDKPNRQGTAQGDLPHFTFDAVRLIGDLKPFHFPTAFPEAFFRPRQGFDVILGNPPWEKATQEEHALWARHWPVAAA